MKLYIVGPDDDGDGPYYLVSEEGECLASHYCSNIFYAQGDLEGNRPERQKDWHERFGEYGVLYIKNQKEITENELLARNKKWMKEHENDKEAIK